MTQSQALLIVHPDPVRLRYNSRPESDRS